MSVWEIELGLMFVLTLAILGVKIFALVSALSFSSESYQAAGKLTKPAWCAILGLGVIVQVLWIGSSPIGLIGLVFTIAALVYLADVRPALAGLYRR